MKERQEREKDEEIKEIKEIKWVTIPPWLIQTPAYNP